MSCIEVKRNPLVPRHHPLILTQSVLVASSANSRLVGLGVGTSILPFAIDSLLHRVIPKTTPTMIATGNMTAPAIHLLFGSGTIPFPFLRHWQEWHWVNFITHDCHSCSSSRTRFKSLGSVSTLSATGSSASSALLWCDSSSGLPAAWSPDDWWPRSNGTWQWQTFIFFCTHVHSLTGVSRPLFMRYKSMDYGDDMGYSTVSRQPVVLCVINITGAP